MLELLVVIAFAVAIKRAIEDTKAAWGQSKAAYKQRAAAKHGGRVGAALLHDAGFLLSQAAHGFPQVRHGFTAGWHEGRRAHVQARRETERARTEHAEARAGLAGELREYRERRKAALDEIRGRRPGGREEVAGEVPSSAAQGRGSGTEARPVPGGETSVPESPARSFWDREPPMCDHGVSPSCSTCDPSAGGEPGEGTGEGTSPVPADYLVTSDDGQTVPGSLELADGDGGHGNPAPLTGEKEPLTEGTAMGLVPNADDIDRREDGRLAEKVAFAHSQAPSATGGSMAGTASDTTYTQQLAELQAIRDDAEQEVNSVRRKRMVNRLDALTSLALDPGTLGEAAEIDDALKRQEEAAQQTLEATDQALHGLRARHGGIQDAVDSSPVPVPAEKEFYAS